MTIHTIVVLDRLIAIVEAMRTTVEDLKVIAMGDLESLPTPEDIDTWLPAVLFKPVQVDPGVPVNLSPRNKESINVDVRYVRKWAETADYHRATYGYAHLIAESLANSNCLGLTGTDTRLTWTKGGVISVRVLNVQYDADDSAAWRGFGMPITVTKMAVEVVAVTDG